jgi:hypothetical protein
MSLLPRPDGTPVRDASVLRRFMPFLLPGRNESVVYFESQLRVEPLEALLETLATEHAATEHAAAGQPEATAPGLFHALLLAHARVLHDRPKLNRFVVGGRLYQRDAVTMAFAVKKRMDDAAPITSVRLDVPRDATLTSLARDIRALAAHEGRSEAPNTSEREMRALNLLPGVVLRCILWAQRRLDALGLLPAAMLRGDPLYVSLFVANLGSIGLDAAYHHLFEYGTTHLFATIGRVREVPVVEAGEVRPGRVVTLRYSFDERICDGFYAARSLERISAMLSDPACLLEPPPTSPATEA